MSTFHIREVQANDDFKLLNELIKQTLVRSLETENIKPRYFVKADRLREMYLTSKEQAGKQSEDSYSRGFVAESDGKIIAFMGVTLNNETLNGYISYGFVEGNEQPLTDLLKQCEQVVREVGGKQLCRFITLLPGKIRNREISFWEKYGFVADEYYHALVKLAVEEWETPEQLDTTNIQSATEIDVKKIIAILNEDGQEELAREFREHYPTITPDHVFLTLQNEQQEIMAIAYYQVRKFKSKNESGKPYDGLGAFSTGIHFRSRYLLPRKEKRRFIRATIQSMKELGIIFASTRISSKDFDAFIEMLAEGFYFQGEEQTVQVRLTKQV